MLFTMIFFSIILLLFIQISDLKILFLSLLLITSSWYYTILAIYYM